MKLSKSCVTVFFVVLVVVGLVIIGLTNNHKISTQVAVQPTPALVPSISASSSPAPTAVPTSQFSAAMKAKVRIDFVGSCQTKGHYTLSECNCAADYLSKNYSETELAKIYVQYHSTNQVPSALEKAAATCTGK